MRFCGTLGLASKELSHGYYKEVFGPCGLQEESSQSGKTTRRFTRLQFDRIGCHRGLVKSILSRLLHPGVTMSRRSSGGGDGIAMDEGQSFGPEVLLVGMVFLLQAWRNSDLCVGCDLFGHVRQLQKYCKA